jgi:hypothetical protein
MGWLRRWLANRGHAEMAQVRDGLRVAVNVRAERYDVERLRERYPDWDRWPKARRHRYCQDHATPVHVGETHNVTTTVLQKYVATALTLDAADSGALDPPAVLVFGDGGGPYNESDTALNSRVGSISITDPSASGTDFTIDEFLSSNELNDKIINELGIESAGGQLWNHAPTDTTYEKDSSFAVIWSVTIPIDDGGA